VNFGYVVNNSIPGLVYKNGTEIMCVTPVMDLYWFQPVLNLWIVWIYLLIKSLPTFSCSYAMLSSCFINQRWILDLCKMPCNLWWLFWVRFKSIFLLQLWMWFLVCELNMSLSCCVPSYSLRFYVYCVLWFIHASSGLNFLHLS
jgi:hypothetical protein